MCLILFAVDAHPELRLIIAANRDEFFARPSAPAGPWPGAEHVIGGRDLEKGGTWLALAQGRRLAAVTNYRDGARKKNGTRSRGLLVNDFVLSRETPGEFIERLHRNAEVYDGFNLIVADSGEVWHYSNIDRHGMREPLRQTTGQRRSDRGLHSAPRFLPVLCQHLESDSCPAASAGKPVRNQRRHCDPS